MTMDETPVGYGAPVYLRRYVCVCVCVCVCVYESSVCTYARYIYTHTRVCVHTCVLCTHMCVCVCSVRGALVRTCCTGVCTYVGACGYAYGVSERRATDSRRVCIYGI